MKEAQAAVVKAGGPLASSEAGYAVALENVSIRKTERPVLDVRPSNKRKKKKIKKIIKVNEIKNKIDERRKRQRLWRSEKFLRSPKSGENVLGSRTVRCLIVAITAIS